MGLKENPFVVDPTFITNGLLKRDILGWGGFKFINDPTFLRAVDDGEKWVDREIKTGLMTDVKLYPLTVALGKALKVQELMTQIKKPDLNGRIFATFDSTHSFVDKETGNTYFINKPSCHPMGSIIGVSKILQFFNANTGLELKNTSGVIFFDKSRILDGLTITLNSGRINPLDDEQRKKLINIVYRNRLHISGGINTITAWQEQIIDHPDVLKIEIVQFNFFEELLRQFQNDPNVCQPSVKGYEYLDVDIQTSPPEFDKLFTGLIFGILPKGLIFSK